MKIFKTRIFLVLLLCFIPSFSLNEIQDLSNEEICEEKGQTDVNDATPEFYTTAKDSGSYDRQTDIAGLNDYSTEATCKPLQSVLPGHNQASDTIVENEKKEQKTSEAKYHASEPCFTPTKNQILQQDDSYSHSYRAISTDGQTAGYQRFKEDELLQCFSKIYDACSLPSLKVLMSTVHELHTEIVALVYEVHTEMVALVYEFLQRIWKLLQERGLLWCLKALMSAVCKVLTKMASMACEMYPRICELLQDQDSMQLEKFHVAILQFLVSFVATTIICKMIKSI